jgi:hypothetical protein
MAENLYKKSFKELCDDCEESMKHTLSILNDVFDRAFELDFDTTLKKSEKTKKVEDTTKSEETPKKTPKKRQQKKVKEIEKKEVSFTEDIITLNNNAPIAAHHSGDKGRGEILFETLE